MLRYISCKVDTSGTNVTFQLGCVEISPRNTTGPLVRHRGDPAGIAVAAAPREIPAYSMGRIETIAEDQDRRRAKARRRSPTRPEPRSVPNRRHDAPNREMFTMTWT